MHSLSRLNVILVTFLKTCMWLVKNLAVASTPSQSPILSMQGTLWCFDLEEALANTDLLDELDDIARKIVKDEQVAEPSEKVFIWYVW